MRRLTPLFIFVAFIWAARLADIVLSGKLTSWFGLVPRSWRGLDGILFMPFLHGDLAHLSANTTPLLVLGGLILLLSPRRFWSATALCILLGGVLTWLFARAHNHIGASGLVFAWFGYLVATGLLERSRQALVGAAVALLLYGTPTLLGLKPSNDDVSWDGHLFGLCAGVLTAWALSRRREHDGESFRGAWRTPWNLSRWLRPDERPILRSSKRSQRREDSRP